MTEPLPQREVEEFWALGLSLHAPYLPRDELERALADGRVQDACSSSSMGTADTYWRIAHPGESASWDMVVVPPGHEAYETPFEDHADDRDVDGVLWAPWRSERLLRLAAGVPDDRGPAVIATCARVCAKLDARFDAKPQPPAPDATAALRQLMRRIDSFSEARLHKEQLRFAVVRAIVAMAWGRPEIAIDVDAAWR